MKRYFQRRLTFSDPPSRSEGIVVENGRVVDVLSYDVSSGEALVLVEQDEPGAATAFFSESQSEPEPEKYTCGAETANGRCSRTVNKEGERCFQH
jgi:hypothetical protein